MPWIPCSRVIHCAQRGESCHCCWPPSRRPRELGWGSGFPRPSHSSWWPGSGLPSWSVRTLPWSGFRCGSSRSRSRQHFSARTSPCWFLVHPSVSLPLLHQRGEELRAYPKTSARHAAGCYRFPPAAASTEAKPSSGPGPPLAGVAHDGWTARAAARTETGGSPPLRTSFMGFWDRLLGDR